jgi:alpha/beta superfamily hydrolase
MMPFYFGTSKRRLFGVYDPAQNTERAGRASLICPPWGNEYIHSHRTLRQLAVRLSQNGFHVLRFDYFGTGDSAGSTGDNDFIGAHNDVETAIGELKDITRIASLTLIGLRLGANLAVEVSSVHASEVDNLIVWDPYTAEDFENLKSAAEGMELRGNSTSVDLAASISELSIRKLVLVTQQKNLQAFGSLPMDHVPSEPPWIENRMQTGVIPVNVLKFILHWLM